MDVTIVIPTKNAGRLFEKVLKKVFAQETTYEYEVICVDSGSSDNTIEIIKKFPCKLYEIPGFGIWSWEDQKLWGFQGNRRIYCFYYTGCNAGIIKMASEFY